MSNKTVIAALGAIVAIGMGTQAIGQTTDSQMMQQKTKTTLMKEMPKGFEKCYGIAKAGQNDCASTTSSCAGQSKVDGAKDAWVGVPNGTCNRIVGGSTTAGSST
jgi:uncharacterized membrane protein